MRWLATFGGLLVLCSPQQTDRAPAPAVAEAQAPDPLPAPPPLAPTSLIAGYETRYVSGTPRGRNIERAVALFGDMLPIEPGETFSFNDRVGPRDGAGTIAWRSIYPPTDEVQQVCP